MKKILIITVIGVIFIIGIALSKKFIFLDKVASVESTEHYIKKDDDTSKNSMSYEEKVKQFYKISATEVLNTKKLQSKFLYIGRKSCPYCRNFVTLLEQIKQELKIDVFYLNSEDKSELEQLKKVGEKFDINTVPTLLFISKDGKCKKYIGENNKEALKEWVKLSK
ncbi:thioredoxin domain-containing protein (plasmid) [Enterococcus faecalis]